MIAIVGSGVAGISAAEALRELGYRGPLRVYGEEPVAPYDRPTLSKGFLLDRALAVPPELYPPARLSELEIELDLGTEVVGLDAGRHRLETAAGESVEYEQLLLATGAEPRRLELKGAELGGVHYLRDLTDARTLRAALRPGCRVAIIGGGVIGLEIAASATQIGARATVIEAAPQLMGRVVPEPFARRLERLHADRGVEVLTGISPIALTGTAGRVEAVELAGGSRVAAETVVVGIGATPRVGLAAAAGLAVDDGIVVDEYFATSAVGVFAAGDAARVFHPVAGAHLRIEQWGPAQEQGRRAAAAMIGVGTPYADAPWMWSDQHDLHLQAAGFGFAASDELVSRGTAEERTGFSCFGLRDGRLVAACGLAVGTGVARTVRAAKLLIEARAPVDAGQLADPETDLRRLARAALPS